MRIMARLNDRRIVILVLEDSDLVVIIIQYLDLVEVSWLLPWTEILIIWIILILIYILDLLTLLFLDITDPPFGLLLSDYQILIVLSILNKIAAFAHQDLFNQIVNVGIEPKRRPSLFQVLQNVTGLDYDLVFDCVLQKILESLQNIYIMAIIDYIIQIVQHFINDLATVIEWIHFDIDDIPVYHITKFTVYLIRWFMVRHSATD